MGNIFSISLPKDLSEFFAKKGAKSEYIQKLLREARAREIKDSPALLKREVEDLENKMADLQKQHNIAVDRLLIFMKQDTISKEAEKKHIRELIKSSERKKTEKIQVLKVISGIDDILRPAVEGKKDFDYFRAVEKLRTKRPDIAKDIDIKGLQIYVESKQGGGKV